MPKELDVPVLIGGGGEDGGQPAFDLPFSHGSTLLEMFGWSDLMPRE